MANDAAFERFQRLLASDGVRAAIVYLNSLTPHRFTSMSRLGAEFTSSLVFVDSEQPGVQTTRDSPIRATYCVFVRDSGQPFALADSAFDPRVIDHAKRDEMHSYCGVPLTGRDGKVFGVLCHYDVHPVPFNAEMVELMEQIAPLLEASQGE